MLEESEKSVSELLEEKDEFESLKVEHMQSAFILLVSGLMIAFLPFLGEYYVFKPENEPPNKRRKYGTRLFFQTLEKDGEIETRREKSLRVMKDVSHKDYFYIYNFNSVTI